jgi:hypothetical protein
MNFNYSEEDIFCFLYTAPILFCVICGNLFGLIFRWFRKSRPLSQNLLLNVLFSHLTIIGQAANIISATFLLTHLVYQVNNHLFSCILQHLRQQQVIASILCFSFVSFAGFLAHFFPKLYSKMNHRWIEAFSCFCWVLLTCAIYLLLRGFHCTNIDPCDFRNVCFISNSRTYFLSLLLLSSMFTGIVFMNIILDKHLRFLASCFVFPKTNPFHGPLQTHPECIEIPTIFTTEPPSSHTLQSVSPKPQITFTTGVITIIFVTVSTGIFSTIFQYFSVPSSSSVQGYVFSLAMTTLVPGYWILANEDIRDFAIRLFKEWICC